MDFPTLNLIGVADFGNTEKYAIANETIVDSFAFFFGVDPVRELCHCWHGEMQYTNVCNLSRSFHSKINPNG
ncbi:MAG: hypothetical protein WA395_15440 [Nitrososphaeraceae archaeon]